MPAPKGSQNAAEYQKSKVEATARSVAAALECLRKGGAIFLNVTNLSKQVQMKTGVSDVTLRRNKRYRSLLQGYLVNQPGATQFLSNREQNVAMLKAKIVELELRLSNKEMQVTRLEAAVRNIRRNDRPLIETEPRTETDLRGRSDHFAQSNHVIIALLGRLQGITVDTKNKRLIDDCAVSSEEAVVAGTNLAGPFVDWFIEQEREP